MPALFRIAALFLAGLSISFALAPPGPAHAHHSFVNKYDAQRVVTIRGTVSSVSWQNPHIFFSVETSAGTWTVEAEGIPKVEGKGLKAHMVEPGTPVSISGWPARDGGAEIGLKSITVKGRTISIRSSAR